MSDNGDILGKNEILQRLVNLRMQLNEHRFFSPDANEVREIKLFSRATREDTEVYAIHKYNIKMAHEYIEGCISSVGFSFDNPIWRNKVLPMIMKNANIIHDEFLGVKS